MSDRIQILEQLLRKILTHIDTFNLLATGIERLNKQIETRSGDLLELYAELCRQQNAIIGTEFNIVTTVQALSETLIELFPKDK